MKYSKEQLAKLNKEEKIKLLETIEEKKKRVVAKGLNFIPHDGQLKILQSTAQTKIITSGNGFGKSTLAVNLLWARAVGNDPWQNKYTKVPLKIICVLDHPSKIADVYTKEIKKWKPFVDTVMEMKQGKPYVAQWTFKNGSTVDFRSWDQDLTLFESIEADFILFDEPPPRAIFIALSRGQREKNSQPETMIVGTPVNGDAAWLRTDFIQPWLEGKLPNVECFTGGTKDNEHNLRTGYLEQFTGLLTDKEQRVRLFGEFSDIDSLAFGHLISDATHRISNEALHWEPEWPVVIGIDPHPSKAHVTAVVGRRPHDDKLFVLEEYSAKLVAKEFAAKLLSITAKYKVVDIVCDSLGSADGTGHDGFKSFIQVLNECGVRARATTFEEKDHEDTVERIRGMLALEEGPPPIFEKSSRLKFTDGGIKAYKELQNVAWIYDRKKEINKRRLDNAKLDYFSALCYALASTWLAPTHLSNNTKRLREPIRFGTYSGTGSGIIKGSGVKHKMKRFYTRDAFSRDDDD